MITTYPTWIRIGGKLSASQVEPLLRAIAEANLMAETSKPPFQPEDAAELLAARAEGFFVFGDLRSNSGRFPHLESTCRMLGLSYARFTAATELTDAELVDWRPEMKIPLIRVGLSADWDRILVDVSIIRQALSLLYSGHVQQAILVLGQACPSVTPLPPFEIV